MNELNRRVKGDKSKWIITCISFVLVFVMLIGICLQVFGTGNVRPSEWFKKSETANSNQITDDKDNVAVSINDKNSGIKLTKTVITSDKYAEYGISTQALSAFTITATALDDSSNVNSSCQLFDWSIAWKGSNSSAVSDYVSMTTTDSTATFSCKKAFSTQIIVTATNRFNSDVSASATIDYAKRLENICFFGTSGIYARSSPLYVSTGFLKKELSFPNIDTFANSSSVWTDDKIYFCQIDSSCWGTGSIDNSIDSSNVTVEVELASDVQEKIKAASGLESFAISKAVYTGDEVTSGVTVKQLFTDLAFSVYSYQVYNHLVGVFMSAFSEFDMNQLNVTVTVPCTYGNVYTKSYVLGGSVTPVAVESARLSESSYIF